MLRRGGSGRVRVRVNIVRLIGLDWKLLYPNWYWSNLLWPTRCAPLSRREWVPIRPPLWSAATAFWPLTLAFDLTPLDQGSCACQVVHAETKFSAVHHYISMRTSRTWNLSPHLRTAEWLTLEWVPITAGHRALSGVRSVQSMRVHALEMES